MVAPDRTYWLAAGLGLMGLACGKANDNKLDDIAARLERIEKKLDAPRPLPRPPQMAPEQDTKTVFAVPIDGDPFIGPPVAKVTIVEASDFA